MNKLIKYALGLLIATVLLAACAASKDTRKTKRAISGDWVLKTVSTEGINGKFTSKVLNEADYNCFIGSIWHFGSNGTGSYTLDGMSKDCPSQKRAINWSLEKDTANRVQLKRMDDNSDYHLSVVTADKANIQLRSEMIVNGHAAAIIYNFEKK